jgi:hypothetical protein
MQGGVNERRILSDSLNSAHDLLISVVRSLDNDVADRENLARSVLWCGHAGHRRQPAYLEQKSLNYLLEN